MHTKHCLALLLVAIAASGAGADDKLNPIFDQLMTHGIKLADGTPVKPSKPAMSEDADAAAEEKILESVAKPHPLSRFVRASRVAPLTLKMKSWENTRGERTGQTVDLWFVAFGKLEVIEEERLFENLFKLGESKSEAQQLTVEQLKARGIELLHESPGREQRFTLLDVDLLKKVQLHGVTQMVITRSDDSLLAALSVDPRFSQDEEFPNRWRPITRDAVGKASLGPPQVFEGFGGYLKATELEAVPGAIFIEMHLVFNEPRGWFGGANLLRSKLPLLLQQNVRSFRSRLSSLSK